MHDKTPWNPSKKATARVKDTLPAPAICQYCSHDVEIVNNAVIYGKSYGEWPWAYRCKNCNAYVGMHPFTNIPLGTLADAETREARKRAKADFNLLWQDGKMNRSEAYQRLANALGVKQECCHIGWFDVAMCERVVAACANL